MSEVLLPREKALKYGIESLSNVELLALILKSAYKDKNVFDLAADLINYCNGFSNLLKLSYEELIMIKGIKKAKALEILAILEICRRLSKVDSVYEDKQLNSLMLVDYLRFKQGFKNQEEFYCIFLNNAGKVIKCEMLFKGTSDKSLVGVDEIFRHALLCKASAIVIAHNHPSGNVKPSLADIEITKQIQSAGKLIGINLLDHLIISDTSFYSFKSNKLLC